MLSVHPGRHQAPPQQVDPSGPLATLRGLLLSDESLANLQRWIVQHWYAVLFVVLAVMVLLVSLSCLTCLCASFPITLFSFDIPCFSFMPPGPIIIFFWFLFLLIPIFCLYHFLCGFPASLSSHLLSGFHFDSPKKIEIPFLLSLSWSVLSTGDRQPPLLRYCMIYVLLTL